MRAYQLHLIAQQRSWSPINQIVSALRFLYGVTLGWTNAFEPIVAAREPQKLPVVLSADEIVQFLQAIPGLRNRAALTTARSAQPGPEGVKRDTWICRMLEQLGCRLSLRKLIAPFGGERPFHRRLEHRGTIELQTYPALLQRRDTGVEVGEQFVERVGDALLPCDWRHRDRDLRGVGADSVPSSFLTVLVILVKPVR